MEFSNWASCICKGYYTGRLKRPPRCNCKDVPIVCGGVRINSGDFVFGDVDGVAAIPKEHVGGYKLSL